MGTALQVVSFLGRAGPKLMLDPGWALTERDICVASRPGVLPIPRVGWPEGRMTLREVVVLGDR
jgi:hypothetical protein